MFLPQLTTSRLLSSSLYSIFRIVQRLALLIRFSPSPFPVEVKVDESPVQVTLCDTAGQDFLDPLRRLCYPDSDVFLLCFSVVKPDTFASIQDKWAPNFKKSHASIVLIGTQADLRTDPRVVSNLLVSHSLVWFPSRFNPLIFNRFPIAVEE